MKPRVLVIAEEANPEWVSVPLVGWSLATALREVAECHIVTQVRNRGAFERSGIDTAAFSIVDNEYVAAPLYKLAERLRGGAGKGWTMLTAFKALGYWSFEREVWRQFGERIRGREFDVVHRVTPLSPTVPSSLARRCASANVPFVLGPLNGGVKWPSQFRDARHKEREWLSYVRGAYKLLPGYRSTVKRSAAILVASGDTRDQLPKSALEKTFYVPENGVYEKDCLDGSPTPRSAETPLRLAFVGRLVPYKGCDMAILGAKDLLKAGRATLDIVGDGPERGALERLVDDAGVRPAVRFLGWTDRPGVLGFLRQAHVFLFPSIREFGGGAVLEAMASGAAPLIVDYGGPAELVTPESGWKVPLGTRAEIVAAVAHALADVVSDGSALQAKRERSVAAVRTLYTWRAKAAQVAGVYDWVLGGRRPPHDLVRGE